MAYIGNEPGKASQRVVDTFTATASQTTFTPSSGYTLGYVDVYLNGVRLINGDDYTATNGTTVVLSSGVSANDVVQCVAYIPRGLSDGYTTAQADARYAQKSNNLSDLGSASTARTNLGLGTLATVSPSGSASSTTFLRGDNSWQTVSVTPTAVSSQANTATDYFDLPSGTTAQRPGSPGTGMIRHNSTTGYPEWYDGTSWQSIQPAIYTLQYVVVGGGGGGGAWVGSGGGAGGYRSSVTGESSGGGASAEAGINALTGTVYTITIGGGGAGSSVASGGSVTTTGANGSDSVFGSITSVGGGRGAAWNAVGATSGGSGGGFDNGQTGSRAGTTGQGYQGGIGSASPNYAGAGGGGAGQTGQNATSVVGGNGGNGVQTSVNGTATYFAGGGGGGVNTPVSGSAPGSGGLGGGGAGRQSNGVSGTAPSGSTNTGGGGGGDGLSGPYTQTTGGNGGSGVVIIRYAGSQRGTGGTVTSSGGYTIHTFTSSGTYTA